LLEAYAVLTRLPAAYRLSPSEAVTVLREPLQLVSMTSAAGRASYDAYTIEVLRSAGVEAIVTYNGDDFRRLSAALHVVDPSDL
jgi:predicted nucleic acid-binding protein